MDCALVQYVNAMCRRLAIAPSRLHPHDLLLSQADLATSEYACLQSVPIESVRLRFSLLQSLNNNLGTFFLPLVDLRSADAYPHNTAAVLGKARSLIFYDTKVTLMNSVLNATAFRKSDLAAPEITLDPLETIGSKSSLELHVDIGPLLTDRTQLMDLFVFFAAEPVDMYGTQFYQAMVKLREVPSSQFCVQLASGGDPIYAFNVRVIGEEVHGTSESTLQTLNRPHFSCSDNHIAVVGI